MKPAQYFTRIFDHINQFLGHNGKTSISTRFLKGGTWAFGGRVALVILGLAIDGLLARLLSPENMGAYVLILSLVTTFVIVAQLGLGPTVVKLIATSLGKGETGVIRESIKKTFQWASVGIIVSVTLFSLFRKWFDIPNDIIGFSLIWIAVLTIQALIAQIALGFHDVRAMLLISGGTSVGGIITHATAVIILSFLLLFYRQISLSTAILVVIIGVVVSLLFGLFNLRQLIKKHLVPNQQYTIIAIPILALALPIMINMLVTVITRQSSVWILSAYSSPESVAIFNAARRLVLMASLALTIANSVLPPLVAELHSQNNIVELEVLLRRTATLVGVPALAVTIFFIVAGSPLLGLVYGSYYQSGHTILIVLAIGNSIQVFTGSCGVVLNMTGHQKILMFVILVSSLLTIIASIIAVRSFGILGVAVTVSAGWAFQNLFMLFMVKYYLGIWTCMSIKLKA